MTKLTLTKEEITMILQALIRYEVKLKEDSKIYQSKKMFEKSIKIFELEMKIMEQKNNN